MKKAELFFGLSFFIIVVLVYFLSSPGNTNYDYFTRLSQSFLRGKLYLEENTPWLNELIPVDGKYYVVYPPMPAVLLVPIELIFNHQVSQTLFSIFLGGVNSILVFILLRRMNFSKATAALVTIFFAFGTNHWYLASVGSAWFIAHVVAIFFLLLSLIECFGKRRLFLIGLLIGASFWARTTVILTIPFFYIFLYKKFWPINLERFKNFLSLNLGIFIFILGDSLYNFVRFRDLSPFSPYQLIPNLDKDPVFKDGFMSLNFIPRHIEAVFFKIPKFRDAFPYLMPSLYATAVWFTSPALIYIFKSKIKLIQLASWSAILLTLALIFLWAGVGYAQFGYRFIQDVMPFLLILLAFGIGQKPSKIAYILVILSIIINAWGTILINKYNLYTF